MAQNDAPNPSQDKKAEAVTAEKIDISGKTGSCPLISGHNLFTGDFNSVNTAVNLVVSSQFEWEQAWALLGAKPPGVLPPNSRALFEAVKKSLNDITVSFRPDKVVVEGKDLVINWQRSNVAKDEDMNAKAGYSVLLLPKKGELKAQFSDIWPVREKRALDAWLEESYKVFKKGSTTALLAPQAAAFRKHMQMRKGRN